ADARICGAAHQRPADAARGELHDNGARSEHEGRADARVVGRVGRVRGLCFLPRVGEKTLYTTPRRPYLRTWQVTRRLLLVRAAPWSNPTGGGPMRWKGSPLRAL